jgi:peptide/nickel transport system ATP-binding protein
MADVVEVDRLRVVAGETTIIKDVSFSVARGEVLALIGESGSGKTTIALSLMGYARKGCRFAGGSVRVGGTEILSLPPAALADVRGRRIAYVAQSAAASFNPAKRLINQVVESTRIHRTMPRAAAEAKALALFRALALPDPARVGARFPHQVSGGQLQRLMAAMALIGDPELVILDEPTTALDVTTQIEVLRAFKRVVRESGTTAIYVSHDLAVVAQIADRIAVLRDGELREIGATPALLRAPADPYTRSLLDAAAPAVRQAETSLKPEPPLLQVRGLNAGYGGVDATGMPRIPVLRDLDFSIPSGSVLGVIGESGCGKSTLARVVAGLLPAAAGSVLLHGEALPARAAERSRDQLRRIQIVFQSADTALNPGLPVGRILGRPLAFYHGIAGAEQRRRVARLLDRVRLPAAIAERYPSELSGGQKQRVNLARALAAEPELILCDEVTSALDTVVGAAILELLDELRRELGVAYMFISHDLSTVKAICDEVMILYAGQKVEASSREALRRPPLHPYTELLIASVPELRPGWLEGIDPARTTEAAAPPLAAASRPCAFFERCAVRVPGLCDVLDPPVRHLAKGSNIRCHRSETELLELGAAAQAAPARPSVAINGR